MKSNPAIRIIVLLSLAFLARAALDPRVKEILTRHIPKTLHLDDPVYPTSANCNGFWNVNRLVCDENQLKAFSRADIEKIDKAEDEMKKLISLVPSAFNLVAADMKRLAPNSYNTLKAIISDGKRATYLRETDKCFAELRMIRKNSLCTTCAATNYEYYFKNRGVLSQADCRTFYEACRLFIQNMGAIVGVPAAYVYDTAYLLDKRFKIPYYTKDEFNYINEVKNQAYKLRDSNSQKEKDKIMAKICDGNVKLTAGSSIVRAITGRYKRLEDALAAYALAKNRKLGLKSPFDRYLPSRSLNSKPVFKFSAEIEDVTTVIRQGRLSSSTVTSAGILSDQRPMNLSLTFAN